jgi:hypothetical protein
MMSDRMRSKDHLLSLPIAEGHIHQGRLLFNIPANILVQPHS